MVSTASLGCGGPLHALQSDSCRHSKLGMLRNHSSACHPQPPGIKVSGKHHAHCYPAQPKLAI
jgi:hypothetical protein